MAKQHKNEMSQLNAHNSARARETRARANVLRQCFWGATALVAPVPKAIAERGYNNFT